MAFGAFINRDIRFLFGPLGAVLLTTAFSLAVFVPGYSSIHQTVSEIGEMDSPMRWPFAFVLFAVAISIVVFATGLRALAVERKLSRVPAYLTAFMAISVAGVAVFAFPHPLHNVFGLSELVGYQAPLVLAIAWRRDPGLRTFIAFSAIMAVVVWLAILANLSTLDRAGALWAAERPVYGIVQRALFASWFGWCFGAGLLLYFRNPPETLLRKIAA